MDLELPNGVVVPEAELATEYSRSGGPGGQHVNKTETRVTLRFSVAESPSLSDEVRARLLSRLRPRLTKDGELLVHVDTHRKRQRNIDLAHERMLRLLAEALEEDKPRKKTRPSLGAKRRRLKAKRQTGEKKRLRKTPDVE